ncbi:uncharacterized protein PGRI_080660 [Penicillium griseofulvum]|uniref:HNH nuclease domain-containing protein n=1 Tax=Penicillium patulum TaxID=5078 RepID=A0A135LV20_PENPA|nr:uncharacterized protein PGRI_080660 [Penicillium griseofulvum]KXG52810.1 hypothetical protein PGRI_080660 [Penicillium griseofulvum]
MSENYQPRPGSPDVPLPDLENRKRTLNDSMRQARKRLRAHGSFDVEFWARAREIEEIGLAQSHLQRKISLQRYEGSEASWKESDEAKEITQIIRAQEQSKKICQKRLSDLDPEAPRRSIRASFVKLFCTSKMGLGITSTGAGRRKSDQQSRFRSQMIEKYNAKHDLYDHLWCPVLGDWRDSEDVVAAHLFAYMHGQTTMDAIFGKTKTPELFSPRNGVMVSKYIEHYLDSGKMVIVPNLPDRPKLAQLLGWLNSDVRSLKIRLLDHSWNKLEHPIVRDLPLKYRDLDNRVLIFRSSFRPAARYLYFHYAIQVLRHAWEQNSQGDKAAETMQAEAGKLFWGTPGRYLPKNMLLALVEELGHEYKPLLDGASISRCGDPQLLLAVAANQVKSRRPALKGSALFFESSDGNDEDENDEDNDEYGTCF